MHDNEISAVAKLQCHQQERVLISIVFRPTLCVGLLLSNGFVPCKNNLATFEYTLGVKDSAMASFFFPARRRHKATFGS